MADSSEADRVGGNLWGDEAVEGAKHFIEFEMSSYVCNPKEGRTFSIGSMLVTMKATGAETNGRFALVEITVPPYYADMVAHLHQYTAKSIYLTHGMLAVTLGEETMVVRQGSFIMVQPQQAHRFWNPAATQATFLVYFAPAGAEEFLEALAQTTLMDQAHLVSALAQIWALGAQHDYFPAELPG